MDQIMEAISLF